MFCIDDSFDLSEEDFLQAALDFECASTNIQGGSKRKSFELGKNEDPGAADGKYARLSSQESIPGESVLRKDPLVTQGVQDNGTGMPTRQSGSCGQNRQQSVDKKGSFITISSSNSTQGNVNVSMKDSLVLPNIQTCENNAGQTRGQKVKGCSVNTPISGISTSNVVLQTPEQGSSTNNDTNIATPVASRQKGQPQSKKLFQLNASQDDICSDLDLSLDTSTEQRPNQSTIKINSCSEENTRFSSEAKQDLASKHEVHNGLQLKIHVGVKTTDSYKHSENIVARTRGIPGRSSVIGVVDSGDLGKCGNKHAANMKFTQFNTAPPSSMSVNSAKKQDICLQAPLSKEHSKTGMASALTTSSMRPVTSLPAREQSQGTGSEVTRPGNSRSTEEGSSNRATGTKRKRKFPGPAGILPCLGQQFHGSPAGPSTDSPVSNALPSTSRCPPEEHELTSSQSFEDLFSEGPWRQMQEELDQQARYIQQHYSVAAVLRKASRRQLPRGKIPLMCVLLESMNLLSADASVSLRDPTGEIKGTLHRQLLKEYASQLQPGTALLLRQVGVFSPSNRNHYLNITPNNLVWLYSRNTEGEVSCSKLSQLAAQDLMVPSPTQCTTTPSREPSLVLRTGTGAPPGGFRGQNLSGMGNHTRNMGSGFQGNQLQTPSATFRTPGVGQGSATGWPRNHPSGTHQMRTAVRPQGQSSGWTGSSAQTPSSAVRTPLQPGHTNTPGTRVSQAQRPHGGSMGSCARSPIVHGSTGTGTPAQVQSNVNRNPGPVSSSSVASGLRGQGTHCQSPQFRHTGNCESVFRTPSLKLTPYDNSKTGTLQQRHTGASGGIKTPQPKEQGFLGNKNNAGQRPPSNLTPAPRSETYVQNSIQPQQLRAPATSQTGQPASTSASTCPAKKFTFRKQGSQTVSGPSSKQSLTGGSTSTGPVPLSGSAGTAATAGQKNTGFTEHFWQDHDDDQLDDLLTGLEEEMLADF